MKVIVGLGNPGKQYENTPHNAGFNVVDKLAERFGCKFRNSLRFDARMSSAVFCDQDVLLVKPETYMNRSGQAVASILRYKKASIEDVVVVVDDADLARGRLRIRGSGGSGGHKGLSSIIESIGNNGFVRVRIGVGREDGADLVEHVLRPYASDERKKMEEVFDLTADAVECIIASGLEEAMNKFNGTEVKFN